MLIPHFHVDEVGKLTVKCDGLITAKPRKSVDVMIGLTKVSINIPKHFQQPNTIFTPPINSTDPVLVLPVIALLDTSPPQVKLASYRPTITR